MTGNTDERLLTVDDVAAMLRLKRQTIYNKVSANEIPHTKIGGALRFRRADIDAWLAANSEEAVA